MVKINSYKAEVFVMEKGSKGTLRTVLAVVGIVVLALSVLAGFVAHGRLCRRYIDG